jgi:hypothetical protein
MLPELSVTRSGRGRERGAAMDAVRRFCGSTRDGNRSVAGDAQTIAAQRRSVRAAKPGAIDGSPRMAAQRERLAFAFGPTLQREAAPDEKELPMKAPTGAAPPGTDTGQEGAPPPARSDRSADAAASPAAPAWPDRTGLPEPLKTGIESLTGLLMDDVEVHHNSAQAAQLNSLAYAQGSDIHLASGQEQHLPHEAWHVVQQAPGRVRPTMQLKDEVAVNDDQGLQRGADVMGARACGHQAPAALTVSRTAASIRNDDGIQRKKSQPDDDSEAAAKRFTAQSEAYARSLANGRTKWALLQGQLARYGSDRREALVTELNEKRAGYARTWNEHYPTKYINKDGGVEAHTRGVKDLESGPQTDKLPYFNKPDPESNTIEAVANYAEKDEAAAAGLGLRNSEVLWRQYLDVARQHYRVNAENRAQKKVGELERMQRSQVTTPVTRQVVNFAYPDGESWNNWETRPALALTNRVWQSDQEEFKAILGTQNVLPALWLLMDHMDELGGKTIASIATRDEEIIVAEFGPDPGAKDMEDEWARNKVDLPTSLSAQWEQHQVKVVPRGKTLK